MPSPATPVRAARSASSSAPEPGAPALAGGVDLDALFRGHSAMVAAIGFRILGRTHEIEDLVQDVFMDACRDLAKIRNPDAVRAWLAVCTIRRARRRLRRRRLRRILGFDQPIDYEQVADPHASPARRALLARVYQALDAVPVEQRLAWTLRHIEGEDLDTVARLCGCSLATAKRRIAAAAQLILEKLA